jgi:hypothetical protein
MSALEQDETYSRIARARLEAASAPPDQSELSLEATP